MYIIKVDRTPRSLHAHAHVQLFQNNTKRASATLYYNAYHQVNNQPAATFGDLHTPDDLQIFQTLINAFKEEAAQIGCRALIGPMNGSTWNDYRMATSHYPPAFLLDVSTPSYWPKLFDATGFQNLATYHSESVDQIIDRMKKMAPRKAAFEQQGIRFEGFDPVRTEDILPAIGQLCLTAFRQNYLYSPISKEAFVAQMKKALPLIHPRYTWIAWHKQKAVGFIFCYPDPLDQAGKTVIVKTLARHPDEIYKGLAGVLSALAMHHALQDSFQRGIHALMLDSNTSTYLSSKFGGTQMKTYALKWLPV